MANQLVLNANVIQILPLRYTPAGVPILEMSLLHHSEQVEAGNTRQISLTVPALVIGQNALGWQHIEGKDVEVTGFLAQKHQKSTQTVLHIQSLNIK